MDSRVSRRVLNIITNHHRPRIPWKGRGSSYSLHENDTIPPSPMTGLPTSQQSASSPSDSNAKVSSTTLLASEVNITMRTPTTSFTPPPAVTELLSPSRLSTQSFEPTSGALPLLQGSLSGESWQTQSTEHAPSTTVILEDATSKPAQLPIIMGEYK